MNNLFLDILDKRVVVFLDDIVIYISMAEEHFELLEKVFTRLHKYTFYCKLKNNSFIRKTSTFLGFNIAPGDIFNSDTKVKSLKK